MKTKLIIILNLALAINAQAGSATWNLSPTNGDWFTSANWTPATVPNDTTAIATFGGSDVTMITRGLATSVSAMVFNPGASAYTFSEPVGPAPINFYGAGITNNSGIIQTFAGAQGTVSYSFRNAATAGNLTVFFGNVFFYDTATAGTASFTAFPSSISQFFNDSTAGNATFFLTGGTDSGGASMSLFDNTTAGSATITVGSGSTSSSSGGSLVFSESTSAGNATITVLGGTVPGINASGQVLFWDGSSASTATLVATAGSNGGEGGEIQLRENSIGTPRIEVFGNARLEISPHNAPGTSVGSIEGDGMIFLGKRILTVGNSVNTIFSGALLDGGFGGGIHGSLIKVGTGTLTLSGGASSYTGGTTINEGTLLVANTTGSATSSGTVQVNAGTLGGSGVISGAVTVGTGSGAGGFLAPAFASNKKITLTLQSNLTLQADAIYIYTFKARTNQTRTDLVIANGVTISGAMISVKGKTQGTLTPGTVLTVINNTSPNPISGSFSNLADGAIVNVNGNKLQASYSGGDGNDLTHGSAVERPEFNRGFNRLPGSEGIRGFIRDIRGSKLSRKCLLP